MIVQRQHQHPGHREQDEANDCSLEDDVVPALPHDAVAGPVETDQKQVAAEGRNEQQPEATHRLVSRALVLVLRIGQVQFGRVF